MKTKKILCLPVGWKVRVKLSATGTYTVLLFRQQQVRMELMCQKASVALALWECIAWASRVQTDKKILYPLS